MKFNANLSPTKKLENETNSRMCCQTNFIKKHKDSIKGQSNSLELLLTFQQKLKCELSYTLFVTKPFVKKLQSIELNHVELATT